MFLGDRRMFQEFTANVYGYILNLWIGFTEGFLRDIMQNASIEAITVNLEKALLTLRILRKLTVYGFQKPHQNQACNYFLKVIFEHAKTTLECSKYFSYEEKSKLCLIVFHRETLIRKRDLSTRTLRKIHNPFDKNNALTFGHSSVLLCRSDPTDSRIHCLLYFHSVWG